MRPVFIYHPEEVTRLVWNPECTHNLATYLSQKLGPRNGGQQKGENAPQAVAVVAKPCDSRAINMLLAEKRFAREQVHVIGVVCDGVQEPLQRKHPTNSPLTPTDSAYSPALQARCMDCDQRTPVVYDTLVGSTEKTRIKKTSPLPQQVQVLEEYPPAERAEFWLSQFDRCIRCYACRQACPMCDCPTCLYERDDSLWAGIGLGINEKRAFHLGRAFHLAGRCVGCNECERVCPMDIPISLLNIKLAQEVQQAFQYQAGLMPEPSPFVTILGGEEAL